MVKVMLLPVYKGVILKIRYITEGALTSLRYSEG